MLNRFKHIIASRNFFSSTDKLLLAVSGGVDSVALCELCHQAGYNFTIAHCNFKLRGEESERDEQFVKELGEKYSVEVLIKKFDTGKFATDNKLSIQEAARKLRYDWFADLIGSLNSKLQTLNFLLTAHHADDNNETLLMNFFRGTGLHGLTAIAEKNDYICRPLLSFSKEELIAFAKENKLGFVEDSSNNSSKYTRNFFRNELLPAISKVYPQVNENLGDNIERFKEIEKLYNYSVGELKKKLCRQKGNETHIPVKQLMQHNNRALIYEIIHPFGFLEKQVDEVIKLSQSESGKYLSAPAGNYRIIRHRHWFIITPLAATEAANIVIDEGIKEMQFALGALTIEENLNPKPQTSNSTASLDLKQITYPLLLRKWKTGDYFYPLGMKKKKKVARFLIDQKLSKTEKENVWVLESNQRIFWVMGYRIDERFKVTEKTKQVLQLVYKTG
jgi:tRNA(Ile)-lysidine synthase